MKRLLPIPDDFTVKMNEMPTRALGRHYGAAEKTILRWIRDCGVERVVNPDWRGASQRRPIPDDFAERAKTQCKFHLTKHYGVSHATIVRWFKRTGLTPVAPPPQTFPLPDDWHEVCPSMTRAELCANYSVSKSVIERWMRETGQRPRGESTVRRDWRPTRGRPGTNLTSVRATSIYEDAANTLRQRGPVYRCDEKGKADFKGKFWRIGLSVLTPDELLERAAKYERRAA